VSGPLFEGELTLSRHLDADLRGSMYYHFAILLLFRPLIKLRIAGSSIKPRDVCSQAADAISGLLRSYSQLYTLRRTPSFVPYFVLTSSIMHLAIGATFSDDRQNQEGSGGPAQSTQATHGPHHPPAGAPKIGPHVAEAISRGIADLTEMAPCHFFAEQALNILRYLAKKWNIDVDVSSESKIDYNKATRPVTSSLNFFSPNITDSDFNCSWGETVKLGLESVVQRTDTRTGDIGKAAEALENPLFWPFPMQGRPMLPTGEELIKAGFELI